MLDNRYDGVVQPEIPQLILSRARRFRVGRDEIDDLQQQIVPLLAQFRFDPARANGATPATAMIGVIDRQLRAHLRRKRRYLKRIERLQGMNGHRLRQNIKCPPLPADSVDLRIDLEQTICRFSSPDREICQDLSHGLRVQAIAKRLGCGRDTIQRAITRIRDIFDAAGLRDWIAPAR